jgi:hypothetical protein
MKIEHMGLSVENPISMGKWYQKNLGFRILRELGSNSEGVIFMEDDHGNVIEIAHIPEMPSLDFKSMNPLLIHLAIECSNPIEEANRLVAAGAEMIGEAIRNDYKGEKILIRDPFGGLTIQLVNRLNVLKKS